MVTNRRCHQRSAGVSISSTLAYDGSSQFQVTLINPANAPEVTNAARALNAHSIGQRRSTIRHWPSVRSKRSRKAWECTSFMCGQYSSAPKAIGPRCRVPVVAAVNSPAVRLGGALSHFGHRIYGRVPPCRSVFYRRGLVAAGSGHHLAWRPSHLQPALTPSSPAFAEDVAVSREHSHAYLAVLVCLLKDVSDCPMQRSFSCSGLFNRMMRMAPSASTSMTLDTSASSHFPISTGAFAAPAVLPAPESEGQLPSAGCV